MIYTVEPRLATEVQHPIGVSDPVLYPADFNLADSGAFRRRLQAVRQLAGALHTRLSSRRVMWGTPSFFDLERPGPGQRRLGPGLSRESDSFWPLSEW
jgi:hypothetical protein